MELLNITYNNKEIAVFYDFYKKYFPSFERDTLESMKKLAFNSKNTKEWNYNIIKIIDNHNFVGGLVYDYFSDINVIIIEFVFITETYRNKSIVKKLMQFIEQKTPNAAIIGEVEKDSANIKFWQNKGFSIISTDYIQPKINDKEKPFGGLVLMSNKPIINLQDVIKNHYWKYCFLNK